MSYDLAVWVGDRPADDSEAAIVHEALYEKYIEMEELATPHRLIKTFVGRLVERWSDIDTGDDSPWMGSPLLGSARGPYIYFGIAWSRADEVSSYAVQVAEQLGLTCFDPQMRVLRS